MYSRAEQYRRRGIEWKQRATQATEPNITVMRWGMVRTAKG
jgi:hypothetical protein